MRFTTEDEKFEDSMTAAIALRTEIGDLLEDICEKSQFCQEVVLHLALTEIQEQISMLKCFEHINCNEPEDFQ